MDRITENRLKRQVRQLAAACGKRYGPAWESKDGRNVAIVGTWYLDVMNPGDGTTYMVHEIDNDKGGVRMPFGRYRMTGRELWLAIQAAQDAIRSMIGEDEYHRRMQPIYASGKAGAK